MLKSIEASINRLNMADRIEVIAGETTFFVRLKVDGVVKTYNASKLYKHLDKLTELQFETNKELFDRWIDIQLH